MKKLFYLVPLFISFIFLGSCTDDFDEINTNPRTLSSETLGPSSMGLVAARSFYRTTYLDRGAFQTTKSLFANIFAQYFATTHPNFDSDRYLMVGGWLNGAWSTFTLNHFAQVKLWQDFAEEGGFELEAAMAKVWKVYTWHRATDFWGPLPYHSFGNQEASVPFDSQEDIYMDFFETLDEAMSVLQANAGGSSFLAGNDLLYNGNIDQWIKFTNSLRLRLAMRIRYVNAGKAQSEAEKAVAGGVIDAIGDNGIVESSTNWPNPYNTISQWSEYRLSADMESILKGYEDTRSNVWFSPADIPDPTDDPEGISFPIEGMRNGQSKVDKGDTDQLNFNKKASDHAPAYTEAGAAGPNIIVLAASESYFLRAEGALIGWNMGGGSAQEFYEQGISTSFAENGLPVENLRGENYISSTNTPASYDGSTEPASNIPIAYDAGASTEYQLEQILTQKWIALFPDSFEAWAEKRRTGYPVLYPRLNSDNPALPPDEIARRVPYVANMYSRNGEATESAVNNLLGGPDNGATKLWWDAK
ncbi:SusD/RagB family nutrient-binding outer membrane lipoprotein [Membranihabitans maritimus]|uniref:SusD/RagB family nutrient-binding outer membrane lipoprotein n=1 Tax=Membranihabitans maritimus TaxID=2904244 RepID=UPI001F247281|nr:SusD/RagB family nutrient-binding outer membrane lipoprotein [Membranihabitans maritimus]